MPKEARVQTLASFGWRLLYEIFVLFEFFQLADSDVAGFFADVTEDAGSAKLFGDNSCGTSSHEEVGNHVTRSAAHLDDSFKDCIRLGRVVGVSGHCSVVLIQHVVFCPEVTGGLYS